MLLLQNMPDMGKKNKSCMFALCKLMNTQYILTHRPPAPLPRLVFCLQLVRDESGLPQCVSCARRGREGGEAH